MHKKVGYVSLFRTTYPDKRYGNTRYIYQAAIQVRRRLAPSRCAPPPGSTTASRMPPIIAAAAAAAAGGGQKRALPAAAAAAAPAARRRKAAAAAEEQATTMPDSTESTPWRKRKSSSGGGVLSSSSTRISPGSESSDASPMASPVVHRASLDAASGKLRDVKKFHGESNGRASTAALAASESAHKASVMQGKTEAADAAVAAAMVVAAKAAAEQAKAEDAAEILEEYFNRRSLSQDQSAQAVDAAEETVERRQQNFMRSLEQQVAATATATNTAVAVAAAAVLAVVPAASAPAEVRRMKQILVEAVEVGPADAKRFSNAGRRVGWDPERRPGKRVDPVKLIKNAVELKKEYETFWKCFQKGGRHHKMVKGWSGGELRLYSGKAGQVVGLKQILQQHLLITDANGLSGDLVKDATHAVIHVAFMAEDSTGASAASIYSSPEI